jgi:dTDP-4-amino-4,6-dideoxygalactose transaminase
VDPISALRGEIPPVGDRIFWQFSAEPLPNVPGYTIHWLDSGTSALAMAILCAKAELPEIRDPEVLVPAYGCPDLIAACLYAGVTPRLVDIQLNDIAYSEESLSAALSSSTLAILAVHFLGIPPNWLQLTKALAKLEHKPWIIEDAAQSLPSWFRGRPSAPLADARILSFGKGKPLSLLGGGALLLRSEVSDPIGQVSKQKRKPGLRLKIACYNQLLKPRLYYWLNHNPFFKPGQTHLNTLKEIYAMDSVQLALLPANLHRYLRRPRDVETLYRDQLSQTSLGLLLQQGARKDSPLLRLPLLCSNSSVRDRLLSNLNTRGLGASSMYKRELVAINNVAAVCKYTDNMANAAQFAQRLITLPLHAGVTNAQLAETLECLAADGNGN